MKKNAVHFIIVIVASVLFASLFWTKNNHNTESTESDNIENKSIVSNSTENNSTDELSTPSHRRINMAKMPELLPEVEGRFIEILQTDKEFLSERNQISFYRFRN